MDHDVNALVIKKHNIFYILTQRKYTKYAESREGRYLTKSKRMSVLLFLRQGMSNQKPLGEHGWVRFQANQMRRPTYKRQLRNMTMTSLQMGVSNQSRVLGHAILNLEVCRYVRIDKRRL